MSRIAYVKGKYVPHAQASVHIEDRGLQFADGIYEVFAVIDGAIVDETGHLDRLERSVKEIRMRMPVRREALRLVMRELVRRNRIGNAMIYLQTTRGVAARDFRIPKDIKPSLIMTVRPVNFDLRLRKALTKTAITVPDIRWGRCDIKTTMLLAPVLARQAASDRGASEVLFVDADGFVTEASASNAWIVDEKGALITRPTVGNVILKGVTRSAVQMLCKKEKLKLIERPFTVQEVYRAKEVFTSSSFALFASIVEVDGRKIGDGKPGSVMKKLYDIYMEYVRRGKQQHWNPQ
jgi:D-alanine transaminase